MKKILLLSFIISLFIGIKSFSQSCPSAVIYDTTNHSACSGQTIQLTCGMPSVVLSPKVFAPGSSDNYIVESIPYNPPCPYTISPSAIDYVIPTDDIWGQLMNINYGQPINVPPFRFSFYGQNNLSNCVIGSNGLLSWDITVASGENFTPPSSCIWDLRNQSPIPNPNIYKNCIFGPYHDIDFGAVGGIGQMYFQVMGTYPCRKIILSFENVPMFSCNDMRAYHMIVLYETTNTIEFYMQNKPLCSTWNNGIGILGIQNADGTQATVVSNYNIPTQWSATNQAWRIRPAGELGSYTEWYRRPVSGGVRIPVGANYNYQINANPNSNDGPQWYIMETSIVRLDGIELAYSDSCIVKPINLPAFIINHNGHVGYNETICKGSDVNIALSGGNNYRMISPTFQNIVDSTITVHPLVNTTYIFEVDNTDEFGTLVCTRTDSIRVIPYSFNVELGDNKIICKDDTVKLWNTNDQVSGTCLWYNNITNPLFVGDTLLTTPQTTGYLYLTLTDSLTCKATDSILITVNNSPEVNITGNPSTTICKGTHTDLTANSSLLNCTYNWNTGQTTSTITVTPTQPITEYIVSVKFPPAMCEKIDTVKVYAIDKPIVNACQDINICYSDTTQIYVTGNATSYYWSANPADANVDNNHSTNITVRPQISTMYVANGINETNCYNSDTVFVYVSPLPEAQMSFNPSIVNDLDPTVIFQDETNGSVLRRWNLSDGSTSSESTFVHQFELIDTTQSFLINLYVENSFGCKDSTTNIIRVSKTHFLWAPNAVYLYDVDPRISQFRVYIDNPIDFELTIFNRWGECIYKTNNQEKAWDCKYKGEFVPQGNYVWMVKYRHEGKRNDVITDKGTFTIYK